MEELVTLVAPDGSDLGTAPKSSVHTHDTPLHRAFSCYVRDDLGRLLITRRALTKTTWPGVWTNSVCGHPAPGEALAAAVLRRVRDELGAGARDVTMVLPDFHYQARDAGGIMENEVCPVLLGRLVGGVAPNPSEVCEWAWIDPHAFVAAVTAAPMVFSPWVRLQVPALVAAGALPGQMP